jgi:cysteine-rich repeat protein
MVVIGFRRRWLARTPCIACIAVVLAACTSYDRPYYPPPVFEDCSTPGDEDGNGYADCDDPACDASPQCRPVCGDGKLQRGEPCDDGNNIDGDGCDTNCTITACGNGIVTAGEACDDGNKIDGDGCDTNCTVTACGNGIATADEECDDGNAIDGDGCDNNCKTTGCGNGITTAGEECDDGNAIDGDGCDTNCTRTACGNGVTTAGEECDDGNAIDGDGCNSCRFAACNSEVPVAPGHDGSFLLPGNILRVIADPTRCFLYALNNRNAQVVVISTASKRELTRVALPAFATDVAVSPNGAFLVVAYEATRAIGIIDTGHWRAPTKVTTTGTPHDVQVDNNGIAYYVGGDFSFGSIAHIDLRSGIEAFGGTLLYGPAIAISSDSRFLFAGESGTTGAALIKYDISSGSPVQVDRIAGFVGDRHVYVSSQGRHVYFAGNQFDGSSLAFIGGLTEEDIHIEDAAERFAVGKNQLFDAELVRPVATLPHRADFAALAGGDQELWTYTNGRIYYVNVADLIGGVALGVHEVDPAPLSSYHLTQLIHDPVRPRLYGLDTDHAAVVVIDTATLQPTRAILVGSTPASFDIDAAGTTLLVGHRNVSGFSRIDLATLTFDRIVRMPRVTTQLAAVGNGSVVTIDEDDDFTTAVLSDASSGATLSEASQMYSPVVGRSADRATVFVGETSLTSANVTRFSVATGTLVTVARSPMSFYAPPHSVLAVPDASAIYYAGGLLDGNDLHTMRYSVTDPILAVTPDGRLALSSRNVYLVATGAPRGSLRTTALALAVSPDSKTAYAFDGLTIHAVNLTAF